VKPLNTRPITPTIVVFSLYVVLLSAGLACAKPTHSVMVPYGHGRSKDLVFPNEAPPAAASMMNWFDLWMKNDGAGIERIPPVQYFVMGDPADPNSPAPSRSGSGPLRPRPIPTSPPSSATFTPTAEA